MVSQRGVLNLFHSDAQRDATPAAATPCGCTAWTPSCSTATRCGPVPVPRLRQRPLPDPGRPAAAARRHGAARRGGLGLRAGGRPRGVDILQNCEVTGIRVDGGRCSASRPRGASSAPARSGWPARATRRGWPPWRACGCRSRATCCRPSCRKGIKPLVPSVVTFGAGHFYISQSDKGGLVFGGSHRRLQFLRPARQPAARRGGVRGGDGADAGARPAAHAALLGRHHGHVDGRLADHRPHAVAGSTSTAAGATAASRRRRPRASASPT